MKSVLDRKPSAFLPDTVDLCDQLFRKPNVEVVRVGHGPGNALRVIRAALELAYM